MAGKWIMKTIGEIGEFFEGLFRKSGPKHAPDQRAADAERAAEEAKEEARKQKEEMDRKLLELEEKQKKVLEAQQQQANARTEEMRQAWAQEAEKLKAERAKKDQEYKAEHAKQNALLRTLQAKEKKREEEIKMLKDYPLPKYLWAYKDSFINIAIFGKSGSGKSTLINTLRDLNPRDKPSGWAGVSHGAEGTMKATRYKDDTGAIAKEFGKLAKLNLWDQPGDGTKNHQSKFYFRDRGVRYFDFVIINTTGRCRKMDDDLIVEMKKFEVPYAVVRNKCDDTISVMMDDEGYSDDEAFRILTQNVRKETGEPRPWVLSARYKFRKEYDFPAFRQHIIQKIKEVRMTKSTDDEKLDI